MKRLYISLLLLGFLSSLFCLLLLPVSADNEPGGQGVNPGTETTETNPEPHVHSYGEWVPLDDIYHSHSCECGHTQSEQHHYSSWKVDPNDNTRHLHVCEECGATVYGKHTYDSGKVTEYPTHSSEGRIVFTCQGCSYSYSETLPPIPHQFSSWTLDENNPDQHIRTCECGEVETGIHEWGKRVVLSEATHVKEGSAEYTCTVCGTKKIVPIPKLSGHTFGEWFPNTTNLKVHTRVCECGETENEEHKFGIGVIVSQPTYTSAGIIKYVCEVCGYEKLDTYGEELPDLPDKPDPVKVRDEMKVRIGISYGTSVQVGYETSAPDGFYLGIQKTAGDTYSFSYLWTIPNSAIAVLNDGNISKKNSSYSMVSDSRQATIGGYHIVLNRSFASKTALKYWIDEKNEFLNSIGLYAFPAYVNGKLQLRIGSFSTSDEASVAVSRIMTNFRGYSFSIASPSTTGLTLIDSNTSEILFEFDSSDDTTCLGALPINNDPSKENYTKNPLGLIYRGVFTYKRYVATAVNGVCVINVLPLEDYIMGVLPYEVSTSWNLETLKAFAIVVRTYTYTTLNKHNAAYGFDLCNTSNCQVYKGMKSVTKSVIDAVNSTAGLVVMYNNKLASCNYASTFGGVSVDAADVWGGRSYPYLCAQLTPWEKFTEHSRGFWIREVNAVDLAKDLNESGYNEIKDEVADIHIDEYCQNSTYVKTITITDIHGNKLELTGPSHIRSVLSIVLYSANFVVGKNQVDYTIGVFLPGTEPKYDDKLGTVQELTSEGPLHILTSIGDFVADLFKAKVLTSKGSVSSDKTESVLRMKRDGDESAYITAKAENPNSFVFVGKGWGHGVGMSQWGAKDLGDAGYKAFDIIAMYYPGTIVTKK